MNFKLLIDIMPPKSFLNNYLTVVLVLTFGIADAQSDCKDIKATIQVIEAGQKSKEASLTIDFNGQASTSFTVSIIGPKSYFKRDVREKEVKELGKGTYTIVFVGKREEDNFCMKHLEFTIN